VEKAYYDQGIAVLLADMMEHIKWNEHQYLPRAPFYQTGSSFNPSNFPDLEPV